MTTWRAAVSCTFSFSISLFAFPFSNFHFPILLFLLRNAQLRAIPMFPPREYDEGSFRLRAGDHTGEVQ
jgi:hypothetical protein